MSSKGGPRAAGTDGSDFQHREQVASQYKISVQLKSKFRGCLLINIVIAAVQLAVFAAHRLNLLESWPNLRPAQWQLTWMLSGLVSLIGMRALSKNKKQMLSLHNLGLIIFGGGGVFFGMLTQYAAHQRHIMSGETSKVADIPVYVIWVAVLAAATGNYLATMIYSIRLQAAWNVKKSR